MNELLGLDTSREAAPELVPVGRGAPPPEAPALEPLAFEVTGVGPPRPFPPILTVRRASSLETVEQVRRWRGQPPDLPLPRLQGQLFPLEPAEMATDALEPVIVRRGSSRRFQRRPIHFRELSTILQQAMAGMPADFTAPPHLYLNHVFLIANAVDGLPPGAYRFHPWHGAL